MFSRYFVVKRPDKSGVKIIKFSVPLAGRGLSGGRLLVDSDGVLPTHGDDASLLQVSQGVFKPRIENNIDIGPGSTETILTHISRVI